MSAPASRASSFLSHWVKLPRPGGSPYTTTSTTPPRVSPSLRAASTSAIMRALVSGSAQRTGSASTRARSAGAGSGVSSGTVDRAERHHVRDDLDAEGLREQLPRDLAERDPRGGLPRAGPLKDGPGVGVPELLHARQVGVAGPRPGQRGVARLPVELFPGDRVGRHDRLPLGPLGVADPDGDRPAERDAVPDPAGELHLVLLELHPRAAPVARPPPRERRGHVLAGDPHPRRHSVTNRGKGLPMRLARRQPPKHAVHPTVSAGSGRRQAAPRRRFRGSLRTGARLRPYRPLALSNARPLRSFVMLFRRFHDSLVTAPATRPRGYVPLGRHAAQRHTGSSRPGRAPPGGAAARARRLLAVIRSLADAER